MSTLFLNFDQRPLSFISSGLRNAYGTVSDLPAKFQKRIKVIKCNNGKAFGDCWIWRTALTESGYGRVDWNGRRYRMAHKVVYEIFFGPIPEGMEVDHICCTPACVNPAHLEVVTRAENLRRSHTTGFGNGTRTHCRRGHAFTERNIYHWRGKRFCLQCQRLRQELHERRKRERAL